MNVLLWTLQILLALHTAVGAAWKWSHSAQQTMPSLAAIPQSVWMTLSIIELLCAIGLIVPAINKRLTIFSPIAAAVVIAEMLLFMGVHFASGTAAIGPIVYWLVVAAISAFIVYGRLVRKSVATIRA